MHISSKLTTYADAFMIKEEEVGHILLKVSKHIGLFKQGIINVSLLESIGIEQEDNKETVINKINIAIRTIQSRKDIEDLLTDQALEEISNKLGDNNFPFILRTKLEKVIEWID